MAMPTVYNVGAIASGTGAINPALPAGTQANDILVLLIENQDATAVGTVTGYTEVSAQFANGGNITRLSVRWKRAVAGETAPSVPDPGDHVLARIIGVRGCITSGNPVNASGGTTELTADTSVSIPGATTTRSDCLVIAAVSTGADTASTAHISAFANASLDGVTERVDNWQSASGGGGGIGACSGQRPNAGTYAATTATVVTANFKALISIALQGEPDVTGPYTGPTPGRIGPTGQWRPQPAGALPAPKFPPTFVGEYETLFSNSTTPKTASVTVQTNDVLVVCGVTADAAKTINTPTGGGLTYTLQQSFTTASNCAVYLWTAVSGSDQSFTLQLDAVGAGAQFWGFNALQYRNSEGVGTSGKAQVTSGAPTIDLTTTRSNSAVALVSADWTAQDGASRIYRTVNAVTPVAAGAGEQTYFRDAAQYSVYVAQWSDVGAPEFKPGFGIASPGSQKYTLAAVEVYGSDTEPPAGGTDATVSAATVAAVGAVPAPTVQAGSAPAPATVAAIGLVGAPTVQAGTRPAPATVAAVGAIGSPTVQAGTAPAPATVVAVGGIGASSPPTDVTITPATVVGVGAVGSPTVQAGTRPAPATVAAVGAIGAPTVQAGTRPAPATVVAIGAIGAPTVRAGSAPAPATVAAVGAVGSPTLQTGQTVPAVTVAAVGDIPAPSITVGGSVNITPAVVAAVASIGSPTLQTGQTASPATVSAVGAIGAPTVRAGSAPTPAAVAAIGSIGAPAVQAGTRPAPATVAALAAVGAPTVRFSNTVTPATLAALAAVGAPVIVFGTTPTPDTLAAFALVGVPLVIATLPTPGVLTSTVAVSRFTSVSRSASAGSVSSPGGLLTPSSSGGNQ